MCLNASGNDALLPNKSAKPHIHVIQFAKTFDYAHNGVQVPSGRIQREVCRPPLDTPGLCCILHFQQTVFFERLFFCS